MANLADIDLLFPFLSHRGPTHSLLAISFVFLLGVTMHREMWRPSGILAYCGHIFSDMLFTVPSNGVMLMYGRNMRLYNFSLNIPFLSFKQLLLEVIIALVAILLWRTRKTMQSSKESETQ